jgi:hypothetical protein
LKNQLEEEKISKEVMIIDMIKKEEYSENLEE